eukprot:2291616-Rhodomonas_salina.1
MSDPLPAPSSEAQTWRPPQPLASRRTTTSRRSTTCRTAPHAAPDAARYYPAAPTSPAAGSG